MHTDEQLAAYALDCLDEDEAARVEEHLDRCARCRGELHGYREVTGQLALATAEVTPEAWVKRRLMQRVERVRRVQEPARRPKWWGALADLLRRTRPAWTLGAVAAILVLIAGNAWLWYQARPGPPVAGDMRVIAMVPAQAVPGAQGRLVISSDGEYGSLVVENLPVPDAGHQYQVWLTRRGESRSGGLLAVNDHGYGVLEILAPDPLLSYSMFSLTLEPAGGSEAPTGPAVMEGGP